MAIAKSNPDISRRKRLEMILAHSRTSGVGTDALQELLAIDNRGVASVWISRTILPFLNDGASNGE